MVTNSEILKWALYGLDEKIKHEQKLNKKSLAERGRESDITKTRIIKLKKLREEIQYLKNAEDRKHGA